MVGYKKVRKKDGYLHIYPFVRKDYLPCWTLRDCERSDYIVIEDGDRTYRVVDHSLVQCDRDDAHEYLRTAI